MTIAEKVKQRRKELGLTQKEVAKKCNKTQQYIQLIESGKRNSNDDLIELFSALGLTIKLEPKK